MYDLKPNAPAEFRGEFKPIATNVPGIQIGEHLPRQARIMDKLAIVRSAYHTNAGHGMGSQWMLTGYQPTIEVNDNIYPACGSVVAKMRGPNEPGLPAYVNLPRVLSLGKAAYLGASYNPFAPDNDPNSSSFQVRNLKLPGRVDASRLGRRRELLQRSRPHPPRHRHARRHPRARHVLPRRAGDGDEHARPSRRSTSSASRTSSASTTAATTWASAACWPGGWSRRA